MCQVTWAQTPWFGFHPSSIYATYHEAGDGHVFVTRCSGGMKRVNKHREREAMDDMHWSIRVTRERCEKDTYHDLLVRPNRCNESRTGKEWQG